MALYDSRTKNMRYLSQREEDGVVKRVIDSVRNNMTKANITV